MKFNCGETVVVRVARISEWHPWFAWFPVRVDDGSCRWLETVERKHWLSYADDGWNYRAKHFEGLLP